MTKSIFKNKYLYLPFNLRVDEFYFDHSRRPSY